MLIIGITGTLGAGKGTIVEYLVRKYNFKHYSVRNFLLQKIREQGLIENRDSMVVVANSLRQKYGSSYIVEQLFNEALKFDNPAIIESIRNVGEIEALNKLGNFVLIAVDANPQIRFERIKSRNSETDKINFEEFLSNELRELNSDDPNSQNISKCLDLAKVVFDNSKNLEHLYKQIDNFFKIYIT